MSIEEKKGKNLGDLPIYYDEKLVNLPLKIRILILGKDMISKIVHTLGYVR